MENKIETSIRTDIGGDEQRIISKEIMWYNEKYGSWILPVWIGSYMFQEKVYQICINGISGVVDGERPYSMTKIFFAITGFLVLSLTVSLSIDPSLRNDAFTWINGVLLSFGYSAYLPMY